MPWFGDEGSALLCVIEGQGCWVVLRSHRSGIRRRVKTVPNLETRSGPLLRKGGMLAAPEGKYNWEEKERTLSKGRLDLKPSGRIRRGEERKWEQETTKEVYREKRGKKKPPKDRGREKRGRGRV